MFSGVSCLLEVDIRKFFDTLDHAHLRSFLQQRIRDGVVLRLIGKWLNAGVMEDGAVTHPESGSPQGGVISPMLANVYLHYVLDQWFAREVQPRLTGRAFVVRYADDFVIGFTDDEDARRVWVVLPKRFGKYGLTIHPDKTRRVPFRKPEGEWERSDGNGPGTFDFLGFTHFWARSRKGNWILKRKTAASRFTRAVKTIAQWCRFHRHDPIAEQHKVLCQKLRGHAAYYGITGNSPALACFRHEVRKVWRKWLVRRRRAWRASWGWYDQLLARFPLPYLHAIHSVCRGVANG
jgi:group II intron reverse transcriptase/maturase